MAGRAVIDLTRPGESEGFKSIVHLGIFGLVCAAGLYNLAACCRRPAPHLVRNVAIYGALAVFEARNALGHVRETIRARDA